MKKELKYKILKLEECFKNSKGNLRELYEMQLGILYNELIT